MVSSTVRETSVAVFPSRSAWWKMSASVVEEPEIKKKRKLKLYDTRIHITVLNDFLSQRLRDKDKQKDNRLSIPANLVSFAVFTP